MSVPARREVAAGALIALLAVAALGGVAANGFVGFDDPVYLLKNPMVRQGVTPAGVAWAFTTFHAANWHPLTWLSHMLDFRLFGADAGAHHLMSLGLHVASSLLLLRLLVGLTGRLWPSALSAALFAVHPLHVESVAWAAERKDVLSTFLALAALQTYVRAARAGRVLRAAAPPALFALALMAKPMPVPLPFILLLLDGWPLGRWGRPGTAALPPARLWGEKLPLFALAAAVSAITVLAQRHGGTLASLDAVPLSARLANAATAYAAYLGKAALPLDLAPFYPGVAGIRPWWGWGGALALLAAVSAGALLVRRRRPWLAAGWLWYLGALLPVIGIVQAGSQRMADRYTYLPLTGVFVAIAWELSAFARGSPRVRRAVAAAAVAAVLVCVAVSAFQVRHWRDTAALFARAEGAAGGDATALVGLGDARLLGGDPRGALEHYTQALGRGSRSPKLLNNIGSAHLALGDDAEAEQWFERSIAVDPRGAVANYNLGKVFQARGDRARAAAHYRATVAAAPLFVPAWANLGTLAAEEGRPREAAGFYRRALELDPGHEPARRGLTLVEGEAPGRD